MAGPQPINAVPLSTGGQRGDIYRRIPVYLEGDHSFAKLEKNDYSIRKVLTEKLAQRWNWMQRDGKDTPLSKMEYKWLSQSGIIEKLRRLRDEEVARIQRAFQRNHRTDAVRNDDFVKPGFITVQAPHYPGVPDIGNMKMLPDPTKCVYIEYSSTNFEYLKCVVEYQVHLANAAEEPRRNNRHRSRSRSS